MSISLLPRSLFWRVLGVIAVGLLLLQGFGFYLAFQDRDRVIAFSADRFMLDRFVQLVQVVDSLPADQRAKVLALFGRSPFNAELSAAGFTGPEGRDDPRARDFAAAVRQRLGDGRAVEARVRMMEFVPLKLPFKAVEDGRVRRKLEDRLLAPRVEGGVLQGGSVPMGSGVLPGTNEDAPTPSKGPPELGEAVEVATQLGDGQWLVFTFGLMHRRIGLPPPNYGVWAFTLAGVLLIALVAAAAVVWPLRQFARRVDGYAADLSLPAMPESGPAEVVSATRAVNRLHERLATLLRTRTHMLTAVSHDLKTPVTRLRLRAELLEEGELKERIHRDLDDMEVLIGTTLDYFRAGTSSDEIATVNLAALLRDIVDHAPQWRDRVQFEALPDIEVQSSRIGLKRVLTNLIDNAVKYGGSAVVSIARRGTGVDIVIHDQGPGIPEGELERVFEPFYRVEASRNRDSGGSGLGLAIAREIARSLGVTLSLSNTHPGLRAVLTLPVHNRP